MDSLETPKPQNQEAERKVSPQEFVNLVLEYLDTDYREEVESINKAIEENPIFADTNSDNAIFTQTVRQAAQQLKLDLPHIISSSKDALEGKEVEIIARPAGNFFYTGKLLDQEERPKEEPVKRRFGREELPEIVETLRETLENRPRQDLSNIVGYSGFLGGLDQLKSAALGTSSSIVEIEKQAKLVISGKPIKVVTPQGRPKIRTAA